ncbi:MAG TPA: CerR family C-terminal domain-containing protein [Geomonas sp.]|nr:CerR family C-terminal domain-containing protein [Geomonas sp.]
MATTKSDAKKEKLLAAAGDVFMEKGFRDATVAEICARAGANVSAVNYHFGSKEALYQESWRHSFQQSLQAYPVDGGIGETAPAEERLRGQLTALIQRIADENNKDFFIAQMELAKPSGLLQEVMRTELIPMRQQTLALVRELLGPEASEQQVHYCEISIISMCVHPMVMQRIAKRTRDKGMPAMIDDINGFADHVVKFALAGIDAIRSEGSKA